MNIFSKYKTAMRHALHFAGAVAVGGVLLACGGGDNSNWPRATATGVGAGGGGNGAGGGGGGPVPVSTFSVSATVSGLAAGRSVTVLETTSGISASFSANGTHTMLATVHQGTTYNLTISAQPIGQSCSVANASGTVAAASVNNVAVNCGNALNLLAGNVGGPGNLDGIGANAAFNNPSATATDAIGNVYVADNSNHTIRRITPTGEVRTLAGLAGQSGSTDGSGTDARFNAPQSIATDASGNVYVADTNNHTIRKINPAGEVSTLAGSPGLTGSTGDTVATALFRFPRGIATDASGNAYVADTGNHTIRKITPDGLVSTVAGLAGQLGTADRANAGSVARFNLPQGITTDASGNVYVADTSNHTIRKITPDGLVSTLAGRAGQTGSLEGTGTAARFKSPRGVATDASGNVYVADTGNSTIRKITVAGEVSTVTGLAGQTGSTDATGTGPAARFNEPQGIATDASGNVYVADTKNHTIRKVTPEGVVGTVAGSAGQTGFTGGTGPLARFNAPRGVATDASGNVYVADVSNNAIRKINPAGEVITVSGFAGDSDLADGPVSDAKFFFPQGVATDALGNVYVADTLNDAIRKITPAGEVSTVVGTDATNGSVLNPGLKLPRGVTTDAGGNVYVVDTRNHIIRKITPAGLVSTVAGLVGQAGSTDSTGTGSVARFNEPSGIATDAGGNVYVTDTKNNTIRKITPDGVVSTLAGSAGLVGSADGTGSAARFNAPSGIATDANGNVYVADTSNNTVRKITPEGAVSTIVGRAGSVGVSLSALPASLASPTGVGVSGGRLFISTANAVVWTSLP